MKRALIIAYYWPPAGGPGVQRWLKFVTYFKEFGIEPVMYVPENPNYPLTDESFVDQVPTDVEILKHPIREPYRWARLISRKKTKQMSSGIISEAKPSLVEKLLLWVRGNFFIPDARVGWVKPSVRFLKNYLAENPVEIVVTTGPPHSLHLIGRKLKQDLNITWVTDFRDPWTTIHYHKSLRLRASSERKHKQLETTVLEECDLVVVTSSTTRKEFELLTETPVEVITNGYDIPSTITAQPDKSFSLAHVGSLLSERNPGVLWEVLSEIASEDPEFSEALEIKLAGAVSEDVIQSIEETGLKQNCTTLGYVSHSEALQLQHNARVLLLIEIDRPETRAILPGKLFEYLAAKRPILALGPMGSDIEGILAETGAGHFYGYSEKEKIRSEVVRLYTAFKKGEGQNIESNTERFSRKELTRSMATLLKNL